MHGNARSSPLGRLGMVLRLIEGDEPVARCCLAGAYPAALYSQQFHSSSHPDKTHG